MSLPRTVLLLFLVLFAPGSGADSIKIKSLESYSGRYRLIAGNKKFCADLSLSPRNLNASEVAIGRFRFINKTQKAEVQSDIDKNCLFREQSRRTDEDKKVTLIRVNEEYCFGNLRSRTHSAVSFDAEGIALTHSIDDVIPLKCTWTKK